MTSIPENAVVVGIDGSDRSQIALQWAAGLARRRVGRVAAGVP